MRGNERHDVVRVWFWDASKAEELPEFMHCQNYSIEVRRERMEKPSKQEQTFLKTAAMPKITGIKVQGIPDHPIQLIAGKAKTLPITLLNIGAHEQTFVRYVVRGECCLLTQSCNAHI